MSKIWILKMSRQYESGSETMLFSTQKLAEDKRLVLENEEYKGYDDYYVFCKEVDSE